MKAIKTLDEKSKEKAYLLYDSNEIFSIEVGTLKGLLHIHKYIFDDLLTCAGKIRNLPSLAPLINQLDEISVAKSELECLNGLGLYKV